MTIDEIDQQHQKLVALINELDQAQRQEKGKDILGTIISGLIRYTHEHFEKEEIYFDRFGYPDAASHKKEHTEFTARISEFITDFQKKKPRLSRDVVMFLCTWLQKHIKDSDMKYVSFFKKNGVR